MRMIHEVWMRRAIMLARRAEYFGWRPFGCVIVDNLGQVVAETFGSERPDDPTRHSEMLAIQTACHECGGLLQGCAIYSTHEPCAMCCGAINHAKLSRVVWGSSRRDLPRLFRQRHCSGLTLLADTSHPPRVTTGVMRSECIALFDAELEALVTADEVVG